MKKFMKILLKILATIICIPLSMFGGFITGLFYAIGWMFYLPIAIVWDIWEN